VESLNAAQGTSKRLSPAARGRIQAYPWHGNVRELKNQLQRAFILYDGVIELSDLTAERAPSPPGPEVGGSLEESERKLILATLQQCNGDKKEAAQILGISPRRCTTDSICTPRAESPPLLPSTPGDPSGPIGATRS